MRYHCIREHDRGYRITTLCRVLGVSRSGYYGWRTHPALVAARQFVVDIPVIGHTEARS